MPETTFFCPRCKQSLGAPSEMAGEIISCPKCIVSLRVPNPKQNAVRVKERPKKAIGCMTFFVRVVEGIGLLLILALGIAIFVSNKQEKDKIAKMTPVERQAHEAEIAAQETRREAQRIQAQEEIEKEKWRKNEEEIKQKVLKIAERKEFVSKWDRMTEKDQMTYCDKLIESDLQKWESATEQWAKDAIRKKMNNPDSFKFVECTSHFVGYGRINVAITFRGTNAFGGVVTNREVIGYDFVFNPSKGEIECTKATFLE